MLQDGRQREQWAARAFSHWIEHFSGDREVKTLSRKSWADSVTARSDISFISFSCHFLYVWLFKQRYSEQERAYESSLAAKVKRAVSHEPLLPAQERGATSGTGIGRVLTTLSYAPGSALI
ncbi:hypothetical protein I7I51_07581 [Histoplasma capsulatum]|uniref:Uncharacterized protein n=1 Tax=Ajellomyces capsulatus TaxID=5037 RepID=A0A8A1LVE7_AJECA|nr:hypothetical protein I7I51_07581 [Histoplasma capsulatum]